MTRDQIPALNALAGHAPFVAESPDEKITPDTAADQRRVQEQDPDGQPRLAGSATRPSVPQDIAEYFLVNNLSLSEAAREAKQTLTADSRNVGLQYRPVLLAQADIGFANRKYNLMYNTKYTTLVEEPDRRGMNRWDEYLVGDVVPDDMERQPVPDARFADLDEPLIDSRIMRNVEKDFSEWCYQTAEVTVRANEKLGVYAGPDISEEAFNEMCAEAAAKELEEETTKLTKKHEQKIDRIEEKLKREQRELKEDEAEHSMRKGEEGVSHVETLLGVLGGRRRSLSSSMSKRRMTERAKADVEESIAAIEAFEEDLKELEEEIKHSLEDLQIHWDEVAADTIEIPVKPYKKDIRIDFFGVAWFPYHIVQNEQEFLELAGYAIVEPH
jgi:hypothetical protein